MSELNPDVQDEVPWSETITSYDEAHFITYIRLLDAEASGADWQDVGLSRKKWRANGWLCCQLERQALELDWAFEAQG